ncbi:MAG: CUB domain-containing protein [Bacteroidota bacterium]
MSNLVVDDCEGILLDSENGDIGGTYDHNENYTFSICIPGNGAIVMDFLSFCTEEDFDFLSIYDGPNISAPQIGDDYHGEIDPPQVVATSGCLTLHFTSDPNVTCTGWEAHWYVAIEDPIPPDILPIPNLPCESNSLMVQFDPAIPCDSAYAQAFRIVGPQVPGVLAAQPTPCNGGVATNVRLTFNNPITASGNYRVIYTTYEVNECGAIDTLISVEPFAVIDCPLFLELSGGDEVCAGNCTSLQVNVTGGLAGSYQYDWGPNLPNTAQVAVCPNEATS